jgi:hypothetical protein
MRVALTIADLSTAASFHSWSALLCLLLSAFQCPAGCTIPTDLFQQPCTHTGVNLAGTLRHLSGHVKQRRSEKLATNVTRLVSMMQQGQGKCCAVLLLLCIWGGGTSSVLCGVTCCVGSPAVESCNVGDGDGD